MQAALRSPSAACLHASHHANISVMGAAATAWVLQPAEVHRAPLAAHVVGHTPPSQQHHLRPQHAGVQLCPRRCSVVAMSTAAASAQQPPADGEAAPPPVQPVAVQIPQYCCGCGVKMQQADPEAPG